jgi:hypothetical protein
MQGLHRLRVDPPIAILASFIGVGGLRLLQDFVPQGALYVDIPSEKLASRSYHLVESIFEQIPADDKSAARGPAGDARPFGERIWSGNVAEFRR